MELISKILIDHNRLFFNEKPLRLYGRVTSPKNFYINDLSIGRWHVKNSEIIHTTMCFKAKYESNSLGMRDNEVNYKNEGIYFIIGDSFAEGLGLNFDERIDANLKIKTLNFGLTDSGPINYYLIYDKFKEISHKGIIIFFYPTNDFVVDIDRFNNNNLLLNNLLWYKTFSNYDGIKFIDLLKYFSKEKYHEKYYFTCDHHLNLNGAKFVATILNKELQ